MATNAEKSLMIKLVVGLFDAAPGKLNLTDLLKALDDGVTFPQVADVLDSIAEFTYGIINANSDSEQVAEMMSHFGLAYDSGTPSPTTAAGQAQIYFAARHAAGDAWGDIILDSVEFLSLPSTAADPLFADTVALLNNKALVAEVFSRTENAPLPNVPLNLLSNVEYLQAVLAGVTVAGPSTEAEAIEYLEGVVPPPAVTLLTVNQDNLAGGATDNTFSAPATQDGAGNLINTLQSVDVVDGGAGTDTLNATLTEGIKVAPTLNNIEHVNVRFAGIGGDDLNLANTSGINTVAIANSTSTGSVSGVGAIANLAVKNQTQNAAFDGSTAATLGLTLDTVGNFTTPTQITVDLGAGIASKVTALNVTANNANAEVEDSTASETIATLTIAATGENILKMTEAAKATAVTISGEGSVDLSEAAFIGALTKFDASTNTGGVEADIQSTKAAVVTTGDGADTIDMDTGGAVDSSVALGKGDDKLFVGAQLANFNKGADGGEGTDIINITDGSKLDAITSKYITNFETLDVSGGTGNYDVSLNNFATVQIDEAINGALLGAVQFVNAPDTFSLNIASKADDGDFAVGNPIAVVGKDYTGTTAKADAETFTLVATLHDGNKDNVADGNINANTITVAGVEGLVIDANVGTLDGGSDALAAAEHILTAAIDADAAEHLTIKGDASVDLSIVTGISIVHTVNATASKGNVTIDLSANTKSVAYNGAEGVDTYTSSAIGDVIYTGKGADVVTLTNIAARDTFVLKAATDSQVTDTNNDGKINSLDSGFDEVIGFTTGGVANSDRLDVTNFGFSGAQRGVAEVTGAVDLAAGDLTSIADLFSSPAGDRGIAYASAAGNSWVFIDANKDGNFTAADDMVVKLTGVAALSEIDINF